MVVILSLKLLTLPKGEFWPMDYEHHGPQHLYSVYIHYRE